MRIVAIIGIVGALLLCGCLNLGGGRQMVTLPWGEPNIVMDSLGTQQKQGEAAGAQFSGADGQDSRPNAAEYSQSGDQAMGFRDASTLRSTDASLAGKQATAAGRETGTVDSSGDRNLDDSITPAINVGPAGGATVTAPRTTGTGTSLSPEDIARLRAILEAADKTVNP